MKKNIIFLVLILFSCTSENEIIISNVEENKASSVEKSITPNNEVYSIGVSNSQNNKLSMYKINTSTGNVTLNGEIQFYNYLSPSPTPLTLDFSQLSLNERRNIFDARGYPFEFLGSSSYHRFLNTYPGIPNGFRFHAYGIFKFPQGITDFHNVDNSNYIVYLEIYDNSVRALIGPKVNVSANFCSIESGAYRINSVSFFDGVITNGSSAIYGINPTLLLDPFPYTNNGVVNLLLPPVNNYSNTGDPTSITVLKRNQYILYGSRQELGINNNSTYYDYRIIPHDPLSSNVKFYRGINKNVSQVNDNAVRVCSKLDGNDLYVYSLNEKNINNNLNRYSINQLNFDFLNNDFSIFLNSNYQSFNYYGLNYRLFSINPINLTYNGALLEHSNFCIGDIVSHYH